MPLNPGGSDTTPDGAADNEGPHCRNCHVGANSCNQCHGTKADGKLAWYYSDRTNLSSAPYSIHGNPGGGGNPYQPQQYVHTSAVINVDTGCLDGGFSFPHRTLGANLLKDELYGVDYDGTPVAAGDNRKVPSWFSSNYGIVDAWNWQSPYATNYAEGTYSVESSGTGNTWQNANAPRPYTGAPAYLGADPSIATSTTVVQNLDSVCIDCHGNATFWNGDDLDYYYEKTYEAGVVGKGWELMWKGLP